MGGIDLGLGTLPVLLAFGSAILVAALIARFLPVARRLLATDAGARHVAIDGLRGLLAVGVMTHHGATVPYFIRTGTWDLTETQLYIHLGQSSVALFFMVSAFLFWGRVLDRGPAMDWRDLLVGRLYRLYPLYLVAMLTIVAIVFAAADFRLVTNPRDFAAGLLRWLLFAAPGAPDLNGFRDTGLLMAGVFWSLRYEWLFYLSLPAFGFLFARTGRPLAALASAAVAAALLVWGNVGALAFSSVFKPQYIIAFTGGIAAAYWVRHPGLAAAARTPLGGGVALAALAAVIALTPTAYAPLPVLGLSVFFVAVASGQDFLGLLRLPALRWLGEISYGVYLMHGFVVAGVLRYAMPPAWLFERGLFLAGMAVTAAAVVAIASLLFLGVERPMIRLGKRHARRLAGAGIAGRSVALAARER